VTIPGQILIKLSGLPDEQQRKVLEFIETLEPSPTGSRPSLYGLFQGIETTEEEIAEARREMWSNVPREGF
jgi:hypothetical protein